MKRSLSLIAALLVSGFDGWAAAESRGEADAVIQIAATLVAPHDIVVEWKDPVPGAAGHIVEWGTKPDDEFIPLGFFPAKETSYKHSKLMGNTNCYYRVRAYYGPASPEVEVSLPKELTDADY